MKKVFVFTLLAVAAAVVAVTSTAASGGGKTLDLRGMVTGFHVALDAKPAGQSAGDIGYETGTLFAHGKRIGRFQGVCTQMPHRSSQRSFTLGLPEGQILIQAGYGPGFNSRQLALAREWSVMEPRGRNRTRTVEPLLPIKTRTVAVGCRQLRNGLFERLSGPICLRMLPPVASALLHKCSIVGRPDSDIRGRWRRRDRRRAAFGAE
jgi:hypothetical protein